MALTVCGDQLLTDRSTLRLGWKAALRRRILGISERQVTLDERRIQPVSERARHRLEQIGRTFLHGYHAALEQETLPSLAQRLAQIEPELQGFAYEGAAMALYLLDRLTFQQRGRFQNYLAGPAASHVYMAHVGAGWVLARLPLRPGAALTRMDPVLRWLAIDGYAFHEAYFRAERVVDQQRIPKRLAGYQRRAFDLGLGRGLWFVEGCDVRRIAARIASFEPRRHPNLWSGVGLACAYASGVEESDVELLREFAATHQPALAQGAAFAAKARHRAGNPAPHTELACQVLCNMTGDQAALVTDEALHALPPDGDEPAFEIWRQRIQHVFSVKGRSV